MLLDRLIGCHYNDVTSELQGLPDGRLTTSVAKKMYGASIGSAETVRRDCITAEVAGYGLFGERPDGQRK
jgi:hypothetical protein